MGEATLAEVAREAGVSPSTASRVLNGSTRRVRPENADRVQAAAARLGYAVDIRAQETARGTSRTVAIVVPSLRDVSAMNVAADLYRLADEHSFVATVNQGALESNRAAERLHALRRQRPCAILFLTRNSVPRAVRNELSQYEAHGGIVVRVELRGDSSHQPVSLTDLFGRIIAGTVSPDETQAAGMHDRSHRRKPES